MKGPDRHELDHLLQLASLKADRARAYVAAANRVVSDLNTAIDGLRAVPVAADPATGLALAKWLVWRDGRLAILNRDLALARAHAEAVGRDAARAVAREEALKMLAAEAVRASRRQAEARAAAGP